MCGIVGAIGAPGKKMYEAFADMLQMDVLRGCDSTGGIVVAKDKKSWWIKNCVLPTDLIQNKEFEKAFKDAADTNIAYVGHNRFATKGSVNTDNAHPFDHDGITLVHNGTLYGQRLLEKGCNGKEDQKFETDSEAITWSIANRGIDETWERVLGAATIVWYDNKKQRLFILSNKQRPFSYGYTKGRTRMFFASEEWMVRAGMERNDQKLENDQVFGLGEDMLWEFRVSRRGRVIGESRQLEPYKRQLGFDFDIRSSGEGTGAAVLSGPHYCPWSGMEGYGSSVMDDNDDNGYLQDIARNIKVRPYSEDSWPTLREMQDWNKEMIPKEDWDAWFKCCAFCGGDVEWDTSVLIDMNNAACEVCSATADADNIDMRSAVLCK
jgi:asparagine synthetase B (glutamine-hydrolysing)